MATENIYAFTNDGEKVCIGTITTSYISDVEHPTMATASNSGVGTLILIYSDGSTSGELTYTVDASSSTYTITCEGAPGTFDNPHRPNTMTPYYFDYTEDSITVSDIPLYNPRG